MKNSQSHALAGSFFFQWNEHCDATNFGGRDREEQQQQRQQRFDFEFIYK